LDPTRRGRINGVTTDGYTVSVMWAVGDVQRLNGTDPQFVVEVPLREAARRAAPLRLGDFGRRHPSPSFRCFAGSVFPCRTAPASAVATKSTGAVARSGT